MVSPARRHLSGKKGEIAEGEKVGTSLTDVDNKNRFFQPDVGHVKRTTQEESTGNLIHLDVPQKPGREGGRCKARSYAGDRKKNERGAKGDTTKGKRVIPGQTPSDEKAKTRRKKNITNSTGTEEENES